MPLSILSPRELDALEAEVTLALADQGLPMDKRTLLVDRLRAIREKIALLNPQ